MENDKCLLCGGPATSWPFSRDPGDTKTGGPSRKFDCKICGRYALSVYERSYIETYCSQEQCLQLSEHVKNHPDKEGNYKILTMEEIERGSPQKTKRLILAGLVICSILLSACACSSQAPKTTQKGISLSDAPHVLDITGALQPNFEHLDAAKEGYSHKDLGLSKYASEVELFASREPYGIIYAYFAIYEKRTQQIDMDALLKDDEQAKYFAKENIKALARKDGREFGVPNIEVTHPAVGDLAVLVEGSITSLGAKHNFDFLTFKVNQVYVFIYSTCFGSDRLSLLPIAHEIEQNVKELEKVVEDGVSQGFITG